MPISLYSATIPNFIQIASATAALVDKAEAYCADNSLDADEMLNARLAEDMAPFTYQVKSVAMHSIGAIEGLRRGSFSPDMTPPPSDFAGLRTRIGDAVAALEALDPAEVDGFEGRDMGFVMGDFRMGFTGEDFLLSFSQPNFYFHATTAYDLMRWKGIPIGKRDFLGRPRLKA